MKQVNKSYGIQKAKNPLAKLPAILHSYAVLFSGAQRWARTPHEPECYKSDGRWKAELVCLWCTYGHRGWTFTFPLHKTFPLYVVVSYSSWETKALEVFAYTQVAIFLIVWLVESIQCRTESLTTPSNKNHGANTSHQVTSGIFLLMQLKRVQGWHRAEQHSGAQVSAFSVLPPSINKWLSSSRLPLLSIEVPAIMSTAWWEKRGREKKKQISYFLQKL